MRLVRTKFRVEVYVPPAEPTFGNSQGEWRPACPPNSPAHEWFNKSAARAWLQVTQEDEGATSAIYRIVEIREFTEADDAWLPSPNC